MKRRPIEYGEIVIPLNGLFQHMPTPELYTVSGMTLPEIDILFGVTCKSRLISPLVDYYVDYDDTTDTASITDLNLQALAKLIEDYHKEKWTRILDTLQIEYNPIYNYYDEHTGEDTNLRTGSVGDETDYGKDITRTYTNLKDETTFGKTSTLTPTGTKSTKYDYTTGNYKESTTDERKKADNEETIERGVWGFNSSSDVDDNTETTKTAFKNENEVSITGYHTDTESYANYKEETAQGGTESTTRTGKYADVLSGTDTSTKTYNNLTDKETYNSVHMGNIGNLTSQKMINEELELRKRIYIQEVINDVKEFVSLSIYL